MARNARQGLPSFDIVLACDFLDGGEVEAAFEMSSDGGRSGNGNVDFDWVFNLSLNHDSEHMLIDF